MAELKTLFLVCLAAGIFLVISRTVKDIVSEWQANRRAAKLKGLEDELDQLCKEISTRSTLRLTSEHIPQRFSSKEAASAFGEKWSRGSADSFWAKAIDSENRDEEHPNFDRTSISGGILYTYPALFFGLKEAHRDDDEWFLKFALAKNQWLRDYLAHLRNGLAA